MQRRLTTDTAATANHEPHGDVHLPEELKRRYELAAQVEPFAVKDPQTVDAEGRVAVEIAGVRFVRCVTHTDHRGSLTEGVNFERTQPPTYGRYSQFHLAREARGLLLIFCPASGTRTKTGAHATRSS
jgi:hypothetical protein